MRRVRGLSCAGLTGPYIGPICTCNITLVEKEVWYESQLASLCPGALSGCHLHLGMLNVESIELRQAQMNTPFSYAIMVSSDVTWAGPSTP